MEKRIISILKTCTLNDLTIVKEQIDTLIERRELAIKLLGNFFGGGIFIDLPYALDEEKKEQPVMEYDCYGKINDWSL